MRITLLGAGNLAFGYAAYFTHAGHAVTIWSPSGRGAAGITGGIRYSGVISGNARVAASSLIGDAIADAELVVIALPANAHHAVMTAAAPHIRSHHTVLVTPVSALSPLTLARELAARRIRATIIGSGTTLLTARKHGPAAVEVATLRNSIGIAALPAGDNDAALEFCRALCGERFTLQDNLLAVSLSNVNPVAHVPLMLCNLTRAEKAERWAIYDCMSGGVAALMKGIDAERLAIMAGFGLEGRGIEEHFHRSFGVPRGELAEMAAAVHAQRGGPAGPLTLETRFILEDVPYGLAFFAAMGRATLAPTPVTDACILLCATVYARNFSNENALLAMLRADKTDPAQLLALARDGYAISAPAASPG